MRRADPACSCGALSDDTLQASESTEVEPTSRPARRLEQRRSEREDIMKASILLCCTPLLFAASCAISTEGEVGEVPEEVIVDETLPTPAPIFANNNCSNVDITVGNLRFRDGVGTP